MQKLPFPAAAHCEWTGCPCQREKSGWTQRREGWCCSEHRGSPAKGPQGTGRSSGACTKTTYNTSMMHSRHPDGPVSIAKLQGATQKANKLIPSLHCSGRTNKNVNLKNPSAFLFVCLFVCFCFVFIST